LELFDYVRNQTKWVTFYQRGASLNAAYQSSSTDKVSIHWNIGWSRKVAVVAG
jgi:hypothetical protein